MVGWHHLLDGHEFEQTLGVGAGQGSLACCSLQGCRELKQYLVTEQQQQLIYRFKKLNEFQQNKPKESYAKTCHNQLSENFCDVEGYHKESEKATYRMGKNIGKSYI